MGRGERVRGVESGEGGGGLGGTCAPRMDSGQ